MHHLLCLFRRKKGKLDCIVDASEVSCKQGVGSHIFLDVNVLLSHLREHLEVLLVALYVLNVRDVSIVAELIHQLA